MLRRGDTVILSHELAGKNRTIACSRGEGSLRNWRCFDNKTVATGAETFPCGVRKKKESKPLPVRTTSLSVSSGPRRVRPGPSCPPSRASLTGSTLGLFPLRCQPHQDRVALHFKKVRFKGAMFQRRKVFRSWQNVEVRIVEEGGGRGRGDGGAMGVLSACRYRRVRGRAQGGDNTRLRRGLPYHVAWQACQRFKRPPSLLSNALDIEEPATWSASCGYGHVLRTM